MSYNKEIDYQSKIDEAVAQGDYVSAAKYEQSRNEKIDSEGLGYEKTNRYKGWLDSTDYSIVLKEQMSKDESAKTVSDTLKKRIEKASGTDGLIQYAYDDVYDQAIRYIMGSAEYGERPQYKSSYEKRISRLLDKLDGIKAFSYDPYKDDLYEFYRQQYVREGERAMEDLLGELSTYTGGVASSYAVSAAAQARENYNNKLTDIIPELYKDQYERYLDSIEKDERALELLLDLSDSEYTRYLDSLGQYNKDREFRYKKESDEREEAANLRKEEAERVEAEIERQREDEAIKREEAAKLREEENKKAEAEIERQREDEAIKREEAANLRKEEAERRKEERELLQDEYNRKQDRIDTALQKWKYLGYLDPESAEILGLPAGLHLYDYDYKAAQQYKIYNK